MSRITKLLIAGRGEIVRRIIRTAREMGIATVAVYADSDAAASFVREADEAVALRGTTSAETYLDVAKLLDAARRTGAEAVHPGYGFLAENADFASAVTGAGLAWVGPRAEAIAAMGDKIVAKKLMTEAGVPTLPAVEVTGEIGDEIRRWTREMGYPLLVKAALGGGGKGMRVVSSEAGLAEAVAGARREAAAAFGNDTVFLERCLEAARHVEIQIFGDRHGNVVHCFERECSIQRRHQKIIEEAPSPAVDAGLRLRLGEAAVAAGKAVGYDNAGTVEFLLDNDRNFYFLEMNTRLQVEHPVTEEITGLDLVREQIRVAEGDPLSFRQEDLRINGHAIEARVYAEDAANDFLPAAGRLLAWDPDPAQPARFESAVETGSEVSPYFDPMLAKVIVRSPTRTEAALRLASVLERLRLHGVTTNRDFLVNILRHDAFLSGDTSTDFIERHGPARERDIRVEEVRAAALAVALATQRAHRAEAGVLATIPPVGGTIRRRCNRCASCTAPKTSSPGTSAAGTEVSRTTLTGHGGEARIVRSEDGRIELEIDGVQRTLSVTSDGLRHWVHGATGEVRLLEVPASRSLSRSASREGMWRPCRARSWS